MNAVVENTPYLALVDNDPHSARLLTRMLLAHGSPAVECFGGAEEGRARLEAVLGNAEATWPSLLIVDLKAHSNANIEFIAAIGSLTRRSGVPVVAMAHMLDSGCKQALYEAGAAAVFFRQAERDAYRREAAGIVSFWARSQRLDAVGM